MTVCRTLSIAAIAVLAAANPRAQSTGAPMCTAASGRANLAFTLHDLDGQPVRLTDYKDKVLVINFWATWCEPCKIEIPAFEDLHSRYHRRGLQIIGINVDEPPSTVKPYARDMKMSYPVLLARDRQDVLDGLGPNVGLPTTIVIGRDGLVCRRYQGFTRKQTFEDIIRRLL